MPVVKPEPFRATIEETSDRIVISNSIRRSWILGDWLELVFALPGLVIFSAFIILAGLLIVVSLSIFGILQWARANGIYPDPAAFPYPFAYLGCMLLPFWLVAFIVIVKAIHGLLWIFFGTETIEVNKAALKIHFKLFNLNQPRIYSMEDVSDFQVDTQPYISATWRALFISREYLTGRIKFKHNRKPLRFGVGLQEAEANRILEIIQKHFPQFQTDDHSPVRLPDEHQIDLGKIKIEDTPAALTITIPNRRKWLLILYLCFCLLVFVPLLALFGRMAYAEVTGGPLPKDWSGVGWIAFIIMLLGFLQCLVELHWALWGAGVVTITDQSVQLGNRSIFSIFSSKFLVSPLSNLRFSSNLSKRLEWIFASDDLAVSLIGEAWNKGVIAFDYGAKTYRFGKNLNESEARQIVALIHQRFPQYH